MDPNFLVRLLYGNGPTASQWSAAMQRETLDQIALDYADRGSTAEEIADFVLSQYTKASYLYKWVKDEPMGAPEKVRSEMYGHMLLFKLLNEEDLTHCGKAAILTKLSGFFYQPGRLACPHTPGCSATALSPCEHVREMLELADNQLKSALELFDFQVDPENPDPEQPVKKAGKELALQLRRYITYQLHPEDRGDEDDDYDISMRSGLESEEYLYNLQDDLVQQFENNLRPSHFIRDVSDDFQKLGL